MQIAIDSFTKGEQAQVIFTDPYPDTTKNSTQINGYLSLSIFEHSRWGISVVGELQKNTLISSEQDVVQYGLNLFHLKQFNDYTGVYSTLDVKYSNDKIKEKEGRNTSLSLSPYIEKADSWIQPNTMLPDSKKSLSTYFQYRHRESIGLDHLSNESLLMPNASFSLEFFPVSGWLQEKLGSNRFGIIKTHFTIVHRTKWTSKESEIHVGNLITYGASLNYEIDKNNSISIGWERSDGPNPMKGLDDQRFDQVALKAKLKL